MFESDLADHSDIQDYGKEHAEADAVITKYLNDGDKAFREILHMLEYNEPKMEATRLKPMVIENRQEEEWLMPAIISLSVIALILIIVILKIITRRKMEQDCRGADKSKKLSA